MNRTKTGHSILFDLMEIIEKLGEQEVKDFSAFATAKREKAKYHTLFRYLIDKTKQGITKDEIDENEVRKWANVKGSYSDMIGNLHTKLIEFLGRQYAATIEATWYKQVNQLMDQAEALYGKGLREHAKIALEKAVELWESKSEKYHYTWNATSGRLAFIRQRFKQGQQTDKIAWTDEMVAVVGQVASWCRDRIRNVADVPPAERERNEAWRAETIFLRLTQLYAEHFKDGKNELRAISERLDRPSSATLLRMANRQGVSISKEQLASAQETTLSDIESVFMRICGFNRAVELGDFESANQFLNLDGNCPISGMNFYPAASMWVLFQFQSMRLGFDFKYGRIAEGATDKQILGKFLAEMETEFSYLPIRLELYQILIHFGNCQFEKALQMTRDLMGVKKSKNVVIGPLKMLELLALWELNHTDCWDKREALTGFFARKSGDEWTFPKAFAAFMLKAPRLDEAAYRVAGEMKELKQDVEKLKKKASPCNPVHQLILWRVHGWESGETNRRSLFG
ncbi:MAG: hypothetical protein RLZZ165_1025 [Bacteroidota bacterium]|jgi:hypothetical protein